MDKLSFQGKTVLITSPQKYTKRMKTVKQNWTNFSNGVVLRPGVSKICDISDGDIFVLVHNGDKGMLRKIRYDIQLGAKEIIDNVCEDIQNFGENLKDNITCMIMGGRPNDSISVKCVNDVADRVEGYLANNNQKADLSIICGLNDVVYPSIFVNCKRGCKIPDIYMPARIDGTVSKEKLEDVFDIVELNNVDLVC